MTPRSYCGAHTGGGLFEEGLRQEMWACLTIQRMVDGAGRSDRGVAKSGEKFVWNILRAHQV